MLKLKQLQQLEQQKLPRRVRIGFYPYTYVRTVVMRALLFKKEDYQKMLKMGFNEIARFLQDSHYKKEINALATEYSGADLLEIALNRNLAESFKKLIRISSEEIALLVKEYIKRKDIEDIKTILRGKFTNANEKQILSSISAAGTLSYDFLESLLKRESVEEILKDNNIVYPSLFEAALNDFEERHSLISIENVLDKHYFSRMIQFSGTLPREGALFKDFLLKEVEVLNLLTILRLKKAQFKREIIRGFIIETGDKTKDAKMMALASLENLDEISKALGKTGYGDLFAKGIEEFRKSSSLIPLETELYKHLLKKSTLFMHQHPLSVDVILGYMFAKDIEVRNLKVIVKGKQLGLSESFIESQLVF